MTDLFCNECGMGLRWGEEYQLSSGSDYDAVCSDCRSERETV